MQCADLYSEALSNMQVTSIKGQWEKGWVPIVAAKSQYFHAVAQQHLGLVAKANKSFGESVARLKVSTVHTLKLQQILQGIQHTCSVFEISGV